MQSLKGYWRRRHYQRLERSGRPQEKNLVQLGRNRRNHRFGRFRIRPKIRLFRLSSPKKLLVRLRDAYVRMMLRFANSSAAFTCSDVGGRTTGFGRPALKEYDQRVIVEIYKTLVAHQILMDGGDGGTKMAQIVCQP